MMMIWDTEIVRSGDYSSVVSLPKLPSNITEVMSNYHIITYNYLSIPEAYINQLYLSLKCHYFYLVSSFSKKMVKKVKNYLVKLPGKIIPPLGKYLSKHPLPKPHVLTSITRIQWSKKMEK